MLVKGYICFCLPSVFRLSFSVFPLHVRLPSVSLSSSLSLRRDLSSPSSGRLFLNVIKRRPSVIFYDRSSCVLRVLIVLNFPPFFPSFCCPSSLPPLPYSTLFLTLHLFLPFFLPWLCCGLCYIWTKAIFLPRSSTNYHVPTPWLWILYVSLFPFLQLI